jgi:hypothetical protein
VLLHHEKLGADVLEFAGIPNVLLNLANSIAPVFRAENALASRCVLASYSVDRNASESPQYDSGFCRRLCYIDILPALPCSP